MTNELIVGRGEIVAPPPWPRQATHRVRNDAEAVAIARDLVGIIAEGAAERDRNDIFPQAQLDLYSGSGLWGMTVPRSHGGAGVSYVTVGEVLRIVSAADSSIGQLSQNHLATVATIRSIGTPRQKDDLFAEVLAGKRFGNAFSETGTRTVADLKTLLRREGADVVVNGVKRYCTGALAADLVQIVTRDEEGKGWLAVADPTPRSVAEAQIAVAEAKITTTESAIEATNRLFELAGTAATDRALNLDRYWRNARAHTLHDPVRWKYAIIGEYCLNGRHPPLHPWN